MSTEPKIARVGAACGRGYLEVAGIVVAVQGDYCRDEKLAWDDDTWTFESLRRAADKINKYMEQHPFVGQ